MHKFYLFLINQDSYKLYKKNSNVLYRTLKNLYQLKSYDLTYGLSIFHQLCDPFSVKLLTNYIQDRVPCTKKNQKTFQILSLFETTYVSIRYSCSIIYSNVLRPEILKTFDIYQRKIFICDFINDDYFWLHEEISKPNTKAHI